jgi:hypothetical protein
LHFDNGEAALKRYKELRFRDMQSAAGKILAGESVSPAMLGRRLADDERPATKRQRLADTVLKASHAGQIPTRDFGDLSDLMQRLGLNYELGDTLMRQGRLGLCLKGKRPQSMGGPEGDFVEDRFLCDRWNARVRPDGAEIPDELPGEARDRVFGEDK